MYCKNCGQEIDTTGNFCQHCGAPITEHETSANSAPMQNLKKPKKPIYKRWWFWVLVVCFVLGSFIKRTDTQSDSSPSIETQYTTATAQKTVETVSESVPETVRETTDIVDIYTAASLIESFVKDNFENCDVSCEEDTITINIWQDGITAGAILAAAGNQEALGSWNEMVENSRVYSESTSDFVDTMGLEDVFVVVNVLNDQNTEKVLLSILDGTVIYDSVND